MKKLFIPGAFVLMVLWAYTKFEKMPLSHFASAEEKYLDELPGSSPNVTQDSHGNNVVSWVRRMNDSVSVFCYAVIDENGKPGNTVVILPSVNIHPHAENLPKVVFKPSGEVIAVWGTRNPDGKNKYSGLINYAQSFDDGKTWTAAKRLVTEAAGDDQRYSDVVLTKNGEAAIIWLDNRKTTTHEGSALYFAVTEGNSGFVREQLVSQPACQCCRTKLYCDSKGNLHAVYRGIINDSIRDMLHVVSTDGGKSFSAPKRVHADNWVLRGCPHTGPSMAETQHGLHFAWFTGGLRKGSYLISSQDGSFKRYDTISSAGTHPQLAAMPGGSLVVVWDESVRIGDQFYKRIGMQLRNERGSAVMTDFITSDTAYSTYPVMAPVNDKKVLVAYSSKEKNREYIKWQHVQVVP